VSGGRADKITAALGFTPVAGLCSAPAGETPAALWPRRDKICRELRQIAGKNFPANLPTQLEQVR
jgi:hypothetical protein